MPTITIRLDDDLLEKINESKGDKTVSAYCKTLIADSLNNPVHDVHISQDYENIKIELHHKTDMLKMCTERTQDLQNQVGFLQLEFQKVSRINEQLLLAPSPEEITKKAWWQFWKK